MLALLSPSAEVMALPFGPPWAAALVALDPLSAWFLLLLGLTSGAAKGPPPLSTPAALPRAHRLCSPARRAAALLPLGPTSGAAMGPPHLSTPAAPPRARRLCSFARRAASLLPLGIPGAAMSPPRLSTSAPLPRAHRLPMHARRAATHDDTLRRWLRARYGYGGQ